MPHASSRTWFDESLLPLKPRVRAPWATELPDWHRLRRRLLLLWCHLATARDDDYQRLRTTMRVPATSKHLLPPAGGVDNAVAAVELGRVLTHHNTLERAQAFLKHCPRSVYALIAQLYLTQAQTALQPLVDRNLRYVYTVTGQPVFNRARQRGFAADLFQHGVIGLVRAVQAFEPERGWKFSTYAMWWIRQEMVRGLHKVVSPVTFSEHLHTKAGQVRRLLETRDAEGYVAQVETAQTALRMPAETVEAAMGIQRTTYESVSFDVALDSVETQSMYTATDPDQKLEQEQLAARIEAALARFDDPRVREILQARFGLGQTTLTLADLGRRYKLSRERIRQLERQGLVALRTYLADLRD